MSVLDFNYESYFMMFDVKQLKNSYRNLKKLSFYFSAPVGLEDVSKYPELFTTLLASGMWTLEDLKKLAGLNFLRVFREVERVNLHSTQKYSFKYVKL